MGIPLPHNTVIAYDNEAGRELLVGMSGEICLKCASEMLGYVENPEEMKKLYHVHPDGTKWIHTGDIGHIDADGFVFIEGRIKRMIMTVRDGMAYKVVPGSIEAVIGRHEAVQESCVVPMRQGNDQLLKAYIVSVGGIDFVQLEAEIRTLCAQNLADNAQPFEYEFVETLPRTSAGKIDYRALEALTK